MKKFTLVELLVVATIIIILALMATGIWANSSGPYRLGAQVMVDGKKGTIVDKEYKKIKVRLYIKSSNGTEAYQEVWFFKNELQTTEE